MMGSDSLLEIKRKNYSMLEAFCKINCKQWIPSPPPIPPEIVQPRKAGAIKLKLEVVKMPLTY